MSDKSRMQTIHLSPYVSVQGTAEELARQYPPLPDEGDRVANLRNRVEMRQIMDDQITVLVPLGELRAIFAVLDSLLPNVQQLQVARDAAEAREQALLSTYDAERKALVENVAMRHDIARLTAELTALRAGQDALVTAAYEAAAEKCDDYADTIENDTLIDGSEGWALNQAAGLIRAMPTAAATAAMNARLRAERNKVRREVAKLYENGGGPGLGGWDYFGDFYDAILAMIEPEGK
ncbi:hypothetical protein IQ03_02434 [Gemmobacter caeni]|uniref:Uncharacterized protein n=1 Tax=Gemmobacter caeni TaxID=589035 RepID=A0A2T6AZ61_9RHOB|nr:hypothetical protein [Gemmobacter caeni]PTX49091.1 hypothetical protein C8N34_108201 [Gemmobacter caeni]TWI98908.1 hypothetical protein IQ03_02434 [Gemmobacter caeni]